MAFGQELKDFVSGFQAGAQIKDRREDRKYRRERDEADRKYREDRAARSDMESDRTYGMQVEKFEWDKNRDGVRDAQWFEMMGLKHRELGLQEDQIKLEHAKGAGADVPGALEESLPRTGGAIPTLPDDAPAGDQQSSRGAIPEDMQAHLASAQGMAPEGMLQRASYSGADEGGSSATAMALFNPDTYFSSIRTAESGGNDRAKNPRSSATGRYQFISSTWNGLAKKYPELGLTPDGRFDPAQQERAIKAFTRDNARSLQSAGIPITNGTMYAAHFLGDGGARKVLGSGNPNAKVSQLVTPDVIRANPFLRDMNVRDFFLWADRKSGGTLSRQQQQQGIRAAKGGLVGALAVDDEEDDLPGMALPEEEVQVADASGAIPIPEARPERPSPSYEGADNSNMPPISDSSYQNGWSAVRVGMEQAIKRSGVDRTGAIDDPELEKARQNYLKGYGAATPQMMKQVLDTVDPDRQMSVSERNMYALGTVYKFFVERGEFDKARETAGSMYQAYRMASNQYLALGQAAAAEGDIDNTIKSMVLAYANIPNGRDLQVTKIEGGYEVKVVDEETGEEVAKKVMEPKDFAAAVMQFNPGTFDDEILTAAGAKAETKTAGHSDRSKIKADIDEAWDMDFADQEIDRNIEVATKSIATSLAQIDDNGIGGSEALAVATELINGGFDIGEDGKVTELFQSKKNPGTSDYTIQFNGQTYLIGGNQLTRLRNEGKKIAKEKAAEIERGEESGGLLRGAIDASKKAWNAPTNAPDPNAERESQVPTSERLSAPREAPGTPVNIPFWADQPAIPEDETEVEGLLRRREEIRQRNDPRLRQVLLQIEERLRELGHED